MQLSRLLLLVLLCATASVQASIEYVKVDSVGHGATMVEAVNHALAEAIGQVQGKRIDSSTQLITTEESVNTTDDASYYASEEYISTVKAQTKGAISRYDILSSGKDGRGAWEVKLLAYVAKHKKTASADRKRIAVLPLRMSKVAYKVSGTQIEAEDIRRRFGEVLVARLVQTRRFTILDREYTEATESELNLAASSEVPVDEQARLGQKLVADYVVAGTFEDLSYETSSKKMRMTGRTVTNGSGYIEVGYRLIDVSLQQIAFSDTVRIPVTDAELKEIAGGRGGKHALASSLLDAAAEKITKTITDQIYPMALVSVKGKNVVIGQGGNGIKSGTRYNIYQRGERLYDPYTKEYLGQNESFCCTVEIDRVAPKVSYGHVIQQDVNLAKGFVPGSYILREKTNVKKVASSGEKTGKKGGGFKKEKNNDDW
jgi:curli biogenesis system outer membrane secretion channel CsgG